MAVAAIERALGETRGTTDRARLLPACAQIMVCAGDVPRARGASDELLQIAASRDAGVLSAVAAQVQGAVDLAGGDAQSALWYCAARGAPGRRHRCPTRPRGRAS